MTGRARSGLPRATAAAIAALTALAGLPAAHAYDPATTHAGLTERAVLASTLHRVLTRRLARPLGLFEPIALRFGDAPARQGEASEERSLEHRLATLDPGGGYRPTEAGVNSALAWVVAGAVIAGTPAERGQHAFYDPSRGSGLAQAGGLFQLGFALRQLLDAGNGFRALFTGTDFNLTGRPATEWLAAPENDVGLARLDSELEAAVASEDPARRSTALARALMALGGVLAVLEDAGEPAHVRNDFRRAYLGTGGTGVFNRSSSFERFVADAYGRLGVPAAAAPVARPTLMAFFTAADRQGLADRTQRRFFSDGSLPEDAIVDRESTPAEVLQDARLTLPYALPRVPRLELKVMGRRRYATILDPEAGAAAGGLDGAKPKEPARRRLFAYERVLGRVRFFLDRAVYADSARALLPEIGAYAAGLIDHVFRAELQLELTDGGTATVGVSGARDGLRRGDLKLFAEDASGRRRVFTTLSLPDALASGPATVTIPPGTRRIGAVLRGEDAAGSLLSVAEKAIR